MSDSISLKVENLIAHLFTLIWPNPFRLHLANLDPQCWFDQALFPISVMHSLHHSLVINALYQSAHRAIDQHVLLVLRILNTLSLLISAKAKF